MGQGENAKVDLTSMNIEELTGYFTGIGEKAFRAKQVYQWLHQKLATDSGEMTSLPVDLRERIGRQCRLDTLKQVECQVSKQDGTRKYLFALLNKEPNAAAYFIESVLMKYKFGNSVCISSQAGCRMGCKFCASAIGGLSRSLHVSEMLGQVYHISRDIGERISHVVVMGTGEPLDNYENLIKFIEMISDEKGLNISQRNITVSTCGIVPNIYRLAEKKFQITLALSLHAASQETRLSLMPVAQKYKLPDVMKACDAYFAKTGRRITYEYSLVHGQNDTKEDAAKLGALLKGKNCHLNLIPVNPVRERSYKQPGASDMAAFKKELEKNGINVTIRRELGRDIDGACGQLRKRYSKAISAARGLE